MSGQLNQDAEGRQEKGSCQSAPLALVSFKLGDEASSLIQILFKDKRSQRRVRGKAQGPLSWGRVMRYLGSFRVSAVGSRGAALEVTACRRVWCRTP